MLLALAGPNESVKRVDVGGRPMILSILLGVEATWEAAPMLWVLRLLVRLGGLAV